MPVQVSYPGVYVQEVASGVRTITGVSTSVAMFIGMTTEGELDRPTRVLSFADYERSFGTDAALGETTDQVRQFFLNGGAQSYVMRIAQGAEAAEARLQDELGGNDVLTLTARSAGAIGGTVRIEVDYDTAQPESTFNMRIFREEADAGGTLREVASETFRELTMRPGAANHAADVLNLQSRLVRAALPSSPPSAVQGFSVAGVLMGTGGSGVEQLRNVIAAADPGAPDPRGRFRISVDGGPFVTAEISRPTNATAPSVDAAITVPVNTALAPTGKSVSVSVVTSGGFNVLQFVSGSSTSDGSVRIAPAAAKDIAIPMQMGVAQGGLEVDGYAPRRPAANGLVSTLGPLAQLPGGLTALRSFAAADPDDVDDLRITDVGGAQPVVGLPAWPAPAGTSMVRGALTGDQTSSLRNLQQNLDYLVTQINAAPVRWTAARHGFRVVVPPDFGGSDADVTATVETNTGGGGTDLGAGGEMLDPTANVRRYRLGATLPGSYVTAVRDGDDGDPPEAAEYTAAFQTIDREVDLFNLMVLPRAAGQSDEDRAALWQIASAFCRERRAFLLVDPPSGWTNVNEATDASTGVATLRLGLVKDHAALYWPRVRIAAPEGGQRTIDPSGSIAGLMSRTDSNRGVWKAPAGVEADLLGVRGVERPISDAENGVINPQAVNAIRVFPGGVVSWGARTMDGFDNSGNDDYKYVPVRRLALFLEESLYRGLKFAVFEPNDEPLWAQIRLAAGAFMNNLFRQGAFQGRKANDAYFVKVDSETTTQNDINLGIVNVVVGFAPLKPAEFVIITLQQKAGQVQV